MKSGMTYERHEAPQKKATRSESVQVNRVGLQRWRHAPQLFVRVGWFDKNVGEAASFENKDFKSLNQDYRQGSAVHLRQYELNKR